MKNNKILVIGIDGGTFDIIRPLIDQGELPVLASLMNNGSWGKLESTIPPDTGPAWVSMMTGVNPGKHGIFFFLENLHNNLRNGKTLGSADIKSPPLWSILSKHGKKIISVNVPFTYPPMAVNGILISGMFIPDSAEVVSYPPHIYNNIKNELGGYEIDDWSPRVISADRSKLHLHYDKIIEGISRITEHRKKAALMLLENYPWDFFMVVFTSIDRYQHLFWKFMNKPGFASSDISSPYANTIYNGYQQLDSAIGEILKKAGENVTVAIVSDHGFGPLEKHFFVNKWLEDIGLLKTKKNINPRKFKIKATNLHRLLTRLMPNISAPKWTKSIPMPKPEIELLGSSELIDWKETKAYGTQSGININLKGREPFGIVEPGKDFEDLLKLIQEQFYLLEDECGPKQAKIADWILRKEEIFKGPFSEEAADLYFSLKNRSYLQNAKINSKSRFGASPVGSGMHRINGIFITSGPHSKKCNTIKPRMIDIAPTLLYLMGLPVFKEMDGRVLEEIIEPDYLESHPVQTVSSTEYSFKSSAYSADDEENIKESLKGLGYL